MSPAAGAFHSSAATSDEIRYRREAGENVLRLTKRLVSAAADT